jgi:hypothetical protein
MDKTARRGHRALKDRRDRKVPKERRVRPDLMELLEASVHRDRKERTEPTDRMALLAPKGLKVPQDRQARPDPTVLQVRWVHRVPKVRRELAAR